MSIHKEKRKKVLISFISYDQDDFKLKSADDSFMKSFLFPDGTANKTRHDIWRPSVAQAQLYGFDEIDGYVDLVFDEYYLLCDNRKSHIELESEVKDDILAMPRHPVLHLENPGIVKPFDTVDVYQCLYRYFARPEFHDPHTQYYVNCTSGTSQMRNCLFLLTQMGHIDALRIAPTPWKNHKQRDRKKDIRYPEDGRRCVKGSYALEDPAEFSKAYQTLYAAPEGTMLGKLTQGLSTRDKSTLEKVQKILAGINNIKDDNFRRRQSILITGETGVGKTQLARNIANVIGAPPEKVIALNCATIRGADPNIQKIELFGSAGTVGNAKKKDGAMKQANGGVLFLDEIGELSLEMQAMLLTTLESGSFIPLGGDMTRPITSTFQLICGTNRPLEQLVEEGGFRRDLFNRINTWHIELKPLREHRADIVENLPTLVAEIGEKCGKKNFQMRGDAARMFLDFAMDERMTKWNGNFRELNAMITRMVILSLDQDAITTDVVESEIEAAIGKYSNGKPPSGQTPAAPHDPPAAPAAQPQPADFRSLVGAKFYDALSPMLKAEYDLIAKTALEEKITDRGEFCRRIYGDDLKPSGLTRRLAKNFRLRFAHGHLERLPDTGE